MSYLVLARKLRPQTFQEIVGQDSVVRTLTNALSSGRIHHAFLLCGPRGTGKTSTARILAKALSCEHGPGPVPCNHCRFCEEITASTSVDVLEIDGASNTGVDDVRALRENARYLPQAARRKIYIIDEVHMLSVSAFNALLKILEEPPDHVTFIFATTEAQKIPVTILSRCQRYDFRRVSPGDLIAMLRSRLAGEGVTIEDAGLELIAQGGEGSVRDCLSLVDQVISFSGTQTIDVAQVRAALGLTDRQTLLLLSERILAGDAEGGLDVLDRLHRDGSDLTSVARAFAAHLRDLAVAAVVRDPGRLLPVSMADAATLQAQARAAGAPLIQGLFDRFALALDGLLRSETPKLVFEMAVLELARLEPVLPVGDLLDRLEALESRLSSGSPPGKPGPRGPARPAWTPPERGPAGSAPAPPVRKAAPEPAPPPVSVSAPVTVPVASTLPEPDPEPAPVIVEAPRPASPPRRGAPQELPADPMGCWSVVVSLIEAKSKRLAASLYRADVVSVAVTPERLEVVLRMEPGAFDVGQLTAPGVLTDLARQLERPLGREVILSLETSGAPAAPSAQPVLAAPTAATAAIPAAAPRSLRQRDEEWRRAEIARRRDEALAHPAVRAATEVLGAEVKDVRPLMD